MDAGDVEAIAHADVQNCYQCGKCSAGCPMAQHMDLLPNRVIRLVQMGQVDKAMRSTAIWQCVSCMTCSTRCPKSVDCAGVMDALRQLSFTHDTVADSQRRTVIFQQAFLDNIRRNGRLRELELVGMFKTKAFLHDHSISLLWKDALLAPQLMARSKLHLRGQRVEDRGIVQRIFQRCTG